jgi:ATP-dependent exoDNAse (exonuclease V) alpha subunit
MRLRCPPSSHRAAVMDAARRQRVDWQRHASMAFADGRPADVLNAYHAHQEVKAHLTTADARQAVVQAWAKGLEATPIHEQMIFAYRRDDVRALNEFARAVRRDADVLGPDQKVQTEYGERVFAAGDRVYFGRNDRELGVKNGSLGTVAHLDSQRLVARLDGDEAKVVVVDLAQYGHVDHGYAVTVHKSQGATVDRSYVLASKLFDASTAYVAMSRHRDHAELHWARDEFGTRAALDRAWANHPSRTTRSTPNSSFAQSTCKAT